MDTMVSISEALALIANEGTNASYYQKKRMKRWLKSQERKNVWTKDELRGMDVEWQWRICTARLALGAFDWEGWQFRNVRNAKIPWNFPVWQGEKVNRLLLFGEQGIGDEIMFASCFKDVLGRAKNVSVECDQRLVSLFQRNFPQFEFRGGEKDPYSGESFDAMLAMGDLPKLFRRKRSDFPKEPYLFPDSERVKDFSEFKGVGVSWKGRQGTIRRKDLGGDVSLQYGYVDHGDLRVPEIDLKDDIEGIYALISKLDKVVSVPTSVVHFAGSQGVPVELVKPPLGQYGDVHNAINWRWDHRHNGGDRSIWHPSVKIFRNLETWKRNEKH